MGRLILASVLGGLVVFICGMAAWMILPFHSQTLQKFSNEAAVTQVIASANSAPGIYVIPNAHDQTRHLTPEEQKMLMKTSHEQVQKGPFAFVAWSPNGTGPMPKLMVRSFLIQTTGAFLISWLLLLSKISDYWARVKFVIILALAAGVLCYLPNWNWMGFPARFTSLGVLDLMISWFLASLVMAKVLR